MAIARKVRDELGRSMPLSIYFWDKYEQSTQDLCSSNPNDKCQITRSKCVSTRHWLIAFEFLISEILGWQS